MPTEEISTGALYMINPDTGEEIELNCIQDVAIEPVEPIDIEPIRTSGEIEISIDVEISDELVQMLMPKKFIAKGSLNEITKQIKEELLSLPMFSFRRIIDYDLYQNKTHKKKRIDKKWAKRYGYTCTVYYY